MGSRYMQIPQIISVMVVYPILITRRIKIEISKWFRIPKLCTAGEIIAKGLKIRVSCMPHEILWSFSFV
jgi:hypothetical protein